jgi:hypothetical protein
LILIAAEISPYRLFGLSPLAKSSFTESLSS